MTEFNEKDFSVIICSVDRPNFLKQTLNHFRHLSEFPKEIILVLGPGNDEFQNQDLPCDVIIQRITERNLSLARNIGLSLCKTKWAIFLDDDAFPSCNWIRDYVSGVNQFRQSVFFSGKVLDPHNLTLQYNGQISNLLGKSEKEEFDGDLKMINSKLFFRTPLGANFAVNKEIAISIGGFNTALTWFLDETEFAIRLNAEGYTLKELDLAIVEHWKSPSEIRDSAGRYISVFQQWHSEGYVAGRYVLPIFGANTTERNLLANATTSLENIIQAKKVKSFDKGTCERLLVELEDGLLKGYKAGAESISTEIEFNTITSMTPANRILGSGKDPGDENKILFIYRNYLDENEAGISLWYRTLINQLLEMNYSIEILCENPNNNVYEFQYTHDENMRIVLAPSSAKNISTVSNLYPAFVQSFSSAVYKYTKKFQTFNPESFIVVPSFEGFGNALTSNSRVITTLHTTSQTIEEIASFSAAKSEVRQDFAKLEKLAISTSSILLANTHSTAEFTREMYKVDRSKIDMIYHGLDPLDYIPENVFNYSNFLFIGRLEPRKGLDLLLDVWEVLATQPKEIKLKVIGVPVGDYGEKQIQRIKQNFAGTIDFLGYVSNEEKMTLISKSSGVLIPSRYESFGLVALEAARQKRVSIGHAAGGLTEILGKGLGLPLNFLDAQKTALEIENLSTNEDYLKKMSDLAFTTFKEMFTSSKMAKDFETKYLNRNNKA